MNSWCNFAHNYQCSFAGVYQPYLPPAPGPFGEFYGFGTYKDVWKMLDMPNVKSNMTIYRERAESLCAMGWKELQDWNEDRKKRKREKKCVKESGSVVSWLIRDDRSRLHHHHSTD